MNTFSTELQLILLIVILILYDSSRLIYTNQMVFIFSKKWSFINDINLMNINGKSLYISNPLLVFQEEYILECNFDEIDFLKNENLPNINKNIKLLLAFFGYVSFFLLVLILPILLLSNRNEMHLLICVSLIYLTSLICGLTIIFSHRKLNISKNNSINLFFEFILCPPFTVNVIKKISNFQKVNNNIISAALRNFNQYDWYKLCTIMRVKIENEISVTKNQFLVSKLEKSLKIFEGFKKHDEQ